MWAQYTAIFRSRLDLVLVAIKFSSCSVFRLYHGTFKSDLGIRIQTSKVRCWENLRWLLSKVLTTSTAALQQKFVQFSVDTPSFTLYQNPAAGQVDHDWITPSHALWGQLKNSTSLRLKAVWNSIARQSNFDPSTTESRDKIRRSVQSIVSNLFYG